MKKILYIFLAAVLALTSCNIVEPEEKSALKRDEAAKVTITFPISIPTDGLSTKAMANLPDVKNIYVAVFGSSGYFSEWVPAEPVTELATENEHIYKLKVKLTTSPSRLSLHIIANSPLSEPPITGISSDDMEHVVMSKVRSQLDKEPNDAYWQKIILPLGVRDSMVVTNGVEQPYLDANGERVPTKLTESQFAHWDPIPMVRNFARIRVMKDAALTNVQIDRIALAYAPAEGPVAPLLPNTYTSDQWGNYISIADDDDETDFWNEHFYMAYPSRTIDNIGAAPYNYKGYSPADLELGTYPASLEDMTPWSATTAATTYLYVYERAKPRPGQKATRVLIHAKNGDEPWKYYALDMVDSNGEPEVLLRNFTYTLTVKQLAGGSGENTIALAADATAADVSADPRATDLTEVSDGVALIATSYIDTTAIRAGSYSVMYRFVPDVESATVQYNDPFSEGDTEGISLQFGYNNGTDGFIEGANSANGNAFASDPAIETNSDGTAKLYVRSGNGWAVATAANGLNDAGVEKWSKINYTTVGTAGSLFEVGYTKTIRVIGHYTKNGVAGRVYRDVQINLIPRKNMIVKCLDKFIEEVAGASETLRIIIPNDITRSMFPLEFKIQAEAGSLTPREGDNLPVSSGKSIVEGQETQSAFFFIKTLSRSDYEDARDTTIGGVQMKYFDCKFKSTKAASATTIWVQNEYFNRKSDDFENFTLRKFTGNSPGTLSIGASTTFTFNMDAAHGSATNRVWHDAENISASVKVIPRIVTVTMVGIQPEMNAAGTGYYDSNLVKGVGTGVYLYHVAGTDTPEEQTVTLHLVAGNATEYSITLTTDNITPNPGLYEPYSVSGTILKSKITNAGFVNASGTAISSVVTLADQPVWFRFTYGGEVVPVTFQLTGLTPNDSRVSGPDGSGNYTFAPTGTDHTQTIVLKTSASSGNCSLSAFAVNDESYDEPQPDSFSLSRISYTMTAGFTNAAGTSSVTQVLALADRDVYFTINYQNEPVPVTFTLTGLAPALDETRVSASGATYTFTPTTTASRQTLHFKTLGNDMNQCAVNNLASTSTAYSQPTANYTLNRFRYNFGTPGFYKAIANNPTVQSMVSNKAGRTVYYRFVYDGNDTEHQAVVITASGLTSPVCTTGTLTSIGDHTWMFAANASTTQNVWITWTTEAVASPSTSTVTISSEAYDNSPSATIARSNRRTVEFSANEFDISNDAASLTKDGVTINFNNVDDDWNTTYIQLGFRYWGTNYSGSMVASTSSGNVVGVNLTFVDNSSYNSPSSVSSSPTGWTASTSSWSGSANSVTLSSGAIGGSGINTRFNRITKVVVTVEE